MKFLWNFSTYLLYVLTYFTSLQRKFIILEGSENSTNSAKAVCSVCFVLYVLCVQLLCCFCCGKILVLACILLNFFSASLMSLVYMFRIREWDGWVHFGAISIPLLQILSHIMARFVSFLWIWFFIHLWIPSP